MAAKVKILIRDVPREIKRAVAREAREHETGMNDVAVAILSAEFGVPFSPTGRAMVRARPDGTVRRAPITDSPDMTLKVAPELRRRIAVSAASSGGTIRGLVLAILAQKLGVQPPSIRRRRRSGRRARVPVGSD